MTTRLTSVRNIPADVKNALVADAAANDTSVTARATQLLAQRFNVAYEPSGRRTGPTAGEADQLQMRLSSELASALWSAAREARVTQSQAAISIWAEHFNVPYRPENRRGRGGA